MQLLIIGSLDGQIGAASQIAISRGAKVFQASDVERGMQVLRSGQGVDLVMIDVSLSVSDLIVALQSERMNGGVAAAPAPTPTPPCGRSRRAPRNTCRCRPTPN